MRKSVVYYLKIVNFAKCLGSACANLNFFPTKYTYFALQITGRYFEKLVNFSNSNFSQDFNPLHQIQLKVFYWPFRPLYVSLNRGSVEKSKFGVDILAS
jgi:hypothetical protein